MCWVVLSRISLPDPSPQSFLCFIYRLNFYSPTLKSVQINFAQTATTLSCNFEAKATPDNYFVCQFLQKRTRQKPANGVRG